MSHRIILNETSYFGKDALLNLVPEIRARGFQKLMIITDAELIKHGVTDKVTSLLSAAAIPFEVFGEVKSNPTVAIVKKGVEAFRASGADAIIAVGGGSPIDTAKAIGIIINNPEFADVTSLEGNAPTKKPAVPTIAIPTTAGTGAEVTINYVITDEEKKRKFVCLDPHDIPQVAIIDPQMMASMPGSLIAATGMDALTHAIEGYITKDAWDMTDMFDIKAIAMIAKNLRGAVSGDITAIENMGIAQYIAGMGFSNAGLGIVHSMAHPLGAYYNTPHGVANAVLLPYVMQYNAPDTGEKFRDIAIAMGVSGAEQMRQEEYRREAVAAVKQLSKDIGIPTLSEIGVKEQDLEALSRDALADVSTPGNPRHATERDIYELYRLALDE